MRRIETGIVAMLALACVLLLAPLSLDAATAEAAAVAVAQNALDRAMDLGSDDIIPRRALRGASIDGILLVYDPQTLAPIYGVAPIQSPEGRLVGLIGVAAEGDRWLWYNFHCPFDRFPPVSAGQAGLRLAALRGTAALQAGREEPILVAGCDKHLYWRFQASPGESWLIDAAVPGAQVLNSLDRSDSRALTPEGPLQMRDESGPDDLGIDFAPTEIPLGYNIPGIPYHFQITDWYCGPASLQMIMDYYGQEIGQNNIADVADDEVNYGTMSDNMRRAAHFSGMSTAIQDLTLRGYRERKLGYACVDASFWTSQASRLKNTVYAQCPVFTLTWFDGSHSAGHFRVVKGYDDNLSVFIVHDPWYAGALCGPDLLINQDYFITNLWAYSGYWCMVASPWVLTPTLPATVAVGETVSVELQVYYPGPTRFKNFYPCSDCRATISLPAGLALASGTATVALPDMDSDDTVAVAWDVVAMGPQGDWSLAFQAQGLLESSSQSYPAYSDTIGGQAYEVIAVGDGLLAGWGGEERLTDDAGSSQTCFPGSRAMVVKDGTVHVVWADTRDTNSEVYYQRRAGGVWQAAVRLTSDPSFSDAPCLAVGTDGSLHVAWVDERDGNQEIYYKRWDHVSGWSTDERVTVYGEIDRSPCITVGDSLVYLAWERRQGGSYRVAAVQFAVRGGAGWSAPVDVDGSPARDSYRPSVAIGPDRLVHVVYERQTSNTANEREKIMHKRWDGLTWSAVTGLSTDVSFSRNPAVAVASDSTVHVVWQDGENGSGDIFYARYDGHTWQPADEIVRGGTEASTPSIAASPSGDVQIAWVDNRHGESEIYAMTRNESGWGDEVRLTRSPGASILPTVATDELGQVYVVWTDLRDGNADLYFRGGQDQASVPGRTAGTADGPLVRLSNPRPLPFRSETRIALTLEKAARVSVQVFDVEGRLLRTLAGGNYAAGTYELVWDGRASSGAKASPGLYFVTCRSQIGESTKPVVLLP